MIVRTGATESGARVLSGRGRLAAGVAATALASVALVRFGLGGLGAYGAFFVGVVAWIGLHDLLTRRIPNSVVLPAALLALAGRCALEPSHALRWSVAGLAAGAMLLILALVRPAGLGMGDVKFGLLLGFGLGSSIVAALVLAFVGAAVYGLVVIAVRGLEARTATFAFGPWLGAAAVAVFLVG